MATNVHHYIIVAKFPPSWVLRSIKVRRPEEISALGDKLISALLLRITALPVAGCDVRHVVQRKFYLILSTKKFT